MKKQASHLDNMEDKYGMLTRFFCTDEHRSFNLETKEGALLSSMFWYQLGQKLQTRSFQLLRFEVE